MSAIELQGLDHVVLRVADLERALAFYRDALGCPVERRLDELGPVRGLVVDVCGEVSRELRDLLVYAAERTVARTWVEDGATSCDRAAAILKQHLYRRLGVASARAVAQTRLNGLRYVGGADPDFANAPPPAREAEADDRDRATAYTFAGGD